MNGPLGVITWEIVAIAGNGRYKRLIPIGGAMVTDYPMNLGPHWISQGWTAQDLPRRIIQPYPKTCAEVGHTVGADYPTGGPQY